MNSNFAKQVFRIFFIFIFMMGTVLVPHTRVIAQSPLPQLTLEISATPATYGQAGDVINYSYLLTNTGSGTLTGPFTITDDQTMVTCPQNITPVDLSNTVLFDHFENGNLAQYASGTPDYVGGLNNFGQAIDFRSGAWLRYDMPGWYQWPAYYDPTGKAGSVDFWVYPMKYNMGLINLNWYNSNTVPGSGHILHMDIDSNGKLIGQAWSSINGPRPLIQLPAGNTTIPLNQWTHVAYTWGASGTRTFVNGMQDAFSPDNLYPALSSSNYLYVPNWGVPGIGYMDDVRITSSSQTNFVASSLAQGESITCNASYVIAQEDVDNGTVTNTAQAHGFFGTAPIDSNQDTATVTVIPLTPDITAAPSNDWISGDEWPVNAEVSIEIDDPNTSDYPDFSTTQIATGGGDFQYWSEYKFSPGDIVTLSDETTTKSLVVSHIKVTTIDAANDVISGITDPNRTMFVFVHGGNGVRREIQSDPSGNWSVDFTGDYDIQPGTEGSLKVFDSDQDMTHADWRAPNPYIEASRDANWIHARDWLIDTVITMTISGSSETYSATMAQAPWNPGDPNDIVADFDLNGYDVKAGDVITATGNGLSKTLTVSQLEATNFDLENDTIQGKGTSGSQIQVCANGPDRCFTRWVTPDASGDWTANYHNPGVGNDDPEPFDIQRGSSGWAAEYETDSDRTWYDWQVPNPTISARANVDYIEGMGWTFGSTVTIEINDPATGANPDYIDTATVGFADWDPNQTWFELDTNDYDIKAGDLVTGTSGNITKELLVSGYEITSFDLETEMVYGTADPGQRVNIWTCWQSAPCVDRDETADQYGNWATNFSVPGEQEWEQATADLQAGSWIDSSVRDEDDDSTMFGWGVSNPTLHAVPTHPEVHGHDWPAGADVTLTIDDDTDPVNGVLYSRTKNADDDPWCGYPCFDLSGVFDLQNGQYVTMTDGVITRVVRVSTLKIMSVDLANDTLSGVAYPGSDVMVNIWSQDGKARHTVADSNGNWLVDFSVSGDEDFEQFTTDITDEDNGRAIQLNPDGTDDGTLEYWPMPNNPPVANAGPDLEDYAGNTVTLDASTSSDPEAGALTYEWDLDNDGQYDDASGITTTTSFNQVGDHIIGLQVTDDGGLSDIDMVTVTVLPWTLKGFYQPVDMNGVYNITRNGATVPFKFEIFAGTAELTDVALIKNITYVQTSCDANAITDQIEVTSTEVTSLHYDAESGQFIYKWKTPRTAGKCYQVTMITADGSSLVAYFRLR